MTETAAEALQRLIVDVPDYPEAGVVFKDITPMLADHTAFAAVIEAMAANAVWSASSGVMSLKTTPASG